MNRLAMLAVFLSIAITGCRHNLQRPYVDAMIKTERVIRDDIQAGDYLPEPGSILVIDQFTKANENADKVLKAKGK